MNNDQRETADGRLTDEEVEQLNALLRRFCTYDLDQFALIKTQTPYGEAYIVMSRALIADTVSEQYYAI
ncbi:hypothetical protein [Streptomyces sp. NPDC001502]|uniref:hypothetical protein n=1 Tax=Streptomyces sp. NPDC001502 TaxID=3364578 RepID=UPI0036BDE189